MLGRGVQARLPLQATRRPAQSAGAKMPGCGSTGCPIWSALAGRVARCRMWRRARRRAAGARVPQAPQSLRRMPSGRSSARVSSTAFTRQAGMPDLRGSSVRCACHHAFHPACCPACCEAPLRLRSGTPSPRVPAWQALEMRWRDLLTQGRAVVAVGDFNICPAPVSPGLSPPAFVFLFALSSYPARTVPPRQGSRLGCRLQIDCAEPDPANHYRSASRRWMRHLLRGTVASAAARGLQQAALPATAGAQQQPAAPGAAGQLQGGGSSIFDWEAAEAAEAAAEGDGSTSPRWQGSAGPDASSCASCIGGRGNPLSENCCFVDTFRHFHPTRTDVATCWSTLTNARSDRLAVVRAMGTSMQQAANGMGCCRSRRISLLPLWLVLPCSTSSRGSRADNPSLNNRSLTPSSKPAAHVKPAG